VNRKELARPAAAGEDTGSDRPLTGEADRRAALDLGFATLAMPVAWPSWLPVDFWATLRGEEKMSRTDTCAWLTLEAYLDRRLKAAKAEGEARLRKGRVGVTARRTKNAGPYVEPLVKVREPRIKIRG